MSIVVLGHAGWEEHLWTAAGSTEKATIVTASDRRPGGSALLVHHALERLGHEARLIARIGADAAGAELSSRFPGASFIAAGSTPRFLSIWHPDGGRQLLIDVCAIDDAAMRAVAPPPVDVTCVVSLLDGEALVGACRAAAGVVIAAPNQMLAEPGILTALAEHSDHIVATGQEISSADPLPTKRRATVHVTAGDRPLRVLAPSRAPAHHAVMPVPHAVHAGGERYVAALAAVLAGGHGQTDTIAEAALTLTHRLLSRPD